MTQDTSRTPVKPYLIHKDADGHVRLTVRTTLFNSWNYPVVRSSLVDETYLTATAARAHAKEHFGAEAGQFVTK